MTSALSIAILLSIAATAVGAEVSPQKPASAEVAKILGIDESRLSADGKEQHPTLDGKVIWMATYRIAGEQDSSLTITPR
jgi:hypothetical protein